MNERIIELLPTLAMSVGVNVVALIVGTLVHELGHAAAGYAAGLRVARVQLGPLEIRDYGRALAASSSRSWRAARAHSCGRC